MEIGFIRLRKDCNKSQWPQLVNGQKQTQEWISSGFRKISRLFYLKKKHSVEECLKNMIRHKKRKCAS